MEFRNITWTSTNFRDFRKLTKRSNNIMVSDEHLGKKPKANIQSHESFKGKPTAGGAGGRGVDVPRGPKNTIPHPRIPNALKAITAAFIRLFMSIQVSNAIDAHFKLQAAAFLPCILVLTMHHTLTVFRKMTPVWKHKQFFSRHLGLQGNPWGKPQGREPSKDPSSEFSRIPGRRFLAERPWQGPLACRQSAGKLGGQLVWGATWTRKRWLSIVNIDVWRFVERRRKQVLPSTGLSDQNEWAACARAA